MTRSGERGIGCVVSALLVATSVPAHAHTLLEEEGLAISVSAWAQAGYFLATAPGGDFDHGPFLGLARMNAEVRYKGWGRAFVQIEGASGDLVLSDAIAELQPIDALALRVGRFKAPTSANFLIPAPVTSFINRPILVDQGLVQKRLVGGELVGKLSTEDLTASLQLGWFIPEPAARALLPDGDGNFVSARALLALSGGLSFHVAFMGLVLADNVAPVGGRRPVLNNAQLDAAVSYVTDGWTGYVEGVVVLDGPGDQVPWSAFAAVLKNIELTETTLSIEPGLRYEVARLNGGVQHRLTANLTLYMIAEFLNVSANYELLFAGDVVGNAGFARLQVGF